LEVIFNVKNERLDKLLILMRLFTRKLILRLTLRAIFSVQIMNFDISDISTLLNCNLQVGKIVTS